MSAYATLTTREIQPGLIEASLNSGPTNSLTEQALLDIIQLHKDLAQDENCRVLLLSGGTGSFFCNGMDPAMMVKSDIKGRQELFGLFIDMVREVYNFPKLELALINGHAMAGGAFLAVACDYRLMATDQGRFSFSEIHVGLPVPHILQELIQTITGPAPLRQLVMEGVSLNAIQAHRIGLVDRASPQSELIEHALKFLLRFQSLSYEALLRMKYELRCNMRNRLDDLDLQGLSEIQYLLGESFESAMLAVLNRVRSQASDPLLDRSCLSALADKH